MRSIVFVIAMGAGALASGVADASVMFYTYTAFPGIPHDLDGSKYYEWGINWTHTNEYITGAVLEIENIYNRGYEEGALYTHLLNNPPLGVTAHPDNRSAGDRFLRPGNGHAGGSAIRAHQSPWIGTWDDSYGGPGHKTTLVYDLGDLGLLPMFRRFVANGRMGFGFDPDSDYSFDQFQLKIYTSRVPDVVPDVVPEPTTVTLLGVGLLALGVRLRRRNR